MLVAVQQVLRLKAGGLLHGGPPCSSWIFLNAGTSRRSADQPVGDESQPSVRQANKNLGSMLK